MKIRFVFALVFALLAAGCSKFHRGPKPDANGMFPDGTLAEGHSALQGHVLDTEGSPVGGARVELTGINVNLKGKIDIGPDGGYTFFIPPGTFTVTVSKDGYATQSTIEETHSKLWRQVDFKLLTDAEAQAAKEAEATQQILGSLTIDDVTDRCGRPDSSTIGLESVLTYSNAFNTGPVVGTRFSTVDLFFNSSAHIDEGEVDGIPYGSHHAAPISQAELPKVMPCLLTGGVAR